MVLLPLGDQVGTHWYGIWIQTKQKERRLDILISGERLFQVKGTCGEPRCPGEGNIDDYSPADTLWVYYHFHVKAAFPLSHSYLIGKHTYVRNLIPSELFLWNVEGLGLSATSLELCYRLDLSKKSCFLPVIRLGLKSNAFLTFSFSIPFVVYLQFLSVPFFLI
jgi:hypothetical protein